MELRQLRYFVKVAELGSFTQASAFLGVAQSALSRHIRALELELGVALLLRNGRGAVLTDAGLKLLYRSKAILDDSERAFQEMRSLKDMPMGLVSIGMPPAIGAIITVPLVERMRKDYPEIQLQLTEGYSGHVHEWLLSGRLDLGLLYTMPRNVGPGCDRLATERLYLIGARGTASRYLNSAKTVDFAAIAKLPLILPARPHAIRRLIDEVAARHHLDVELGLEVNAFLAIRDLVIHGHGFTILPIAPLLNEVHSGLLDVVPITNPSLSQIVGLVTSSHHSASFATKTVAGAIKRLAHELVTSKAWPESYAPGHGMPSKLAHVSQHVSR